MEQTDIIGKYFTGLTEVQAEAYRQLGGLYTQWNSCINVISRRDIGGLYERHVLHSLAIASFLGELASGTTVLDVGTGGGFPGIPLAILYPQCHFLLLDRIGKKLRVAQAVAEAVGLDNVEFQHGDAGECHRTFNYVVSRAAMPLDGLVRIAARNVTREKTAPGAFPNGLVCLKGGDLKAEIAACHRGDIVTVPVSDYFDEPFFDTKQIVYIPFVKK